MASIKPFFRLQHLRSAISCSSPSTRSLPLLSQASFFPSIIPTTTSTRAASTSSTTATTTETKTWTKKPPRVPQPTPFVPDVPTFLTVIGRDLKQHASKIPDWEALFTLTSEQLRELGVEPPRSRKYLIRWRQRFRLGQYGVGGDLKHVQDGKAELHVLEADPTTVPPNELPRKIVVNTPPGRSLKDSKPEELSRVLGYHVEGAKTIVGPYAMPVKGGEGACITVTEGMWEDRRGRKIDGGERRRTEVRYKRRVAQRREARERGEL
ncbi:IGR protein motif-domain-containing protein [Xylariaceae sp. FL0594]|nr:IGR protein motif-domain-containing protein [Xylariaceae sp. FL0594]